MSSLLIYICCLFTEARYKDAIIGSFLWKDYFPRLPPFLNDRLRIRNFTLVNMAWKGIRNFTPANRAQKGIRNFTPVNTLCKGNNEHIASDLSGGTALQSPCFELRAILTRCINLVWQLFCPRLQEIAENYLLYSCVIRFHWCVVGFSWMPHKANIFIVSWYR